MDMKYFAGLLDADGCIKIQARKLVNGNFVIQANVSINQCSFRADPLVEMANHYSVGVFREKKAETWNEATTVTLTCKKAVNFLEHVKNHLVIKQDIAEYVISISGKEVNQDVLKAIKKILKDMRNTPKHANRPFPSSRWFSGYFDGDGCLRAQVTKEGGVRLRMEITTYKHDLAGVELLQKNYGGAIGKHGNNALRWVKNLDETNCKIILSDIVKHSRMKRTQIEYALGFIGNGKHLLKKGGSKEANIRFKETLQQMKQPHRLSEQNTSQV